MKTTPPLALRSLTPFRTVALALLAWAMVVPLTGCTTNAATGRKQLNYYSREDEIALGQEAGPVLTQEYGGAVTDPKVVQYVSGVGMSMTRFTEADYPSLPWKFTLLNSEVINAFALPGGQVFLSRGLAEKLHSEAEMAGVLGHEIGHVTAEHADRGIENQLPTLILGTAGAVLAGNDQNMQLAVAALVTASGTFALSYSREQESEADKLGMRYMTRAGYDPRGMLGVMRVLADASKGGGAPPEFLSTHPAPETRIKAIDQRLKNKTYAPMVNNPSYGDFAERYRTEFLDPIRSYPRPRTPKARLDLSDPESWCAVCAARRAGQGLALRPGAGSR